jgi:hypothetical protein
VTELSDASFGYQGWKLWDHYRTHDMQRLAEDEAIAPYELLAGFQRYVAPSRVAILIDAQLDPRALVAAIVRGRARIGWREVGWEVVRIGGGAPAPQLRLEPGELVEIRYPLTGEEWRRFIAERRRLARSPGDSSASAPPIRQLGAAAGRMRS